LDHQGFKSKILTPKNDIVKDAINNHHIK
jgi:hypothetical protein